MPARLTGMLGTERARRALTVARGLESQCASNLFAPAFAVLGPVPLRGRVLVLSDQRRACSSPQRSQKLSRSSCGRGVLSHSSAHHRSRPLAARAASLKIRKVLTHLGSDILLVEHFAEGSESVPLGSRSTMGVGGPARYFVEAKDEANVLEAIAWAERRKVELRVLGGGSHVVIADRGVDGLVVKVKIEGRTVKRDGPAVEIEVGAGEAWDPLVAWTVSEGWAGLECLSGIPGLVGAAPIQNVGAYGQDVSETIIGVRALDRYGGIV